MSTFAAECLMGSTYERDEMTDETSIDDLFADDKPKAGKPKQNPKAKPTAKIVVEELGDDELANLAAKETRKGIRTAAEAEIARRADPEKRSAAPGNTELIDNAVNIRRLDWECVCGNTNTHDLQLCGKCRAPRFTTN